MSEPTTPPGSVPASIHRAGSGSTRIYLDHNATSPLDPRVLEAMLPLLRQDLGNPASVHSAGRQARAEVETARERIASTLGVEPRCMRFTGGGTETNNLLVMGLARARRSMSRRIVSAPIEHSSILGPLEHLAEHDGFEMVMLPVAPDGRVRPGSLESALNDGPAALVSLAVANNEVGTVQELEAFASLCAARGVPLHTDASQALGKLPVERILTPTPPAAATFSLHKLGGPPGVGMAYVRPDVAVDPVLFGGGQEDGVRPGTLNVPGAVGAATAIEIAGRELDGRSSRWRDLVETIRAGINGLAADAVLNGPADPAHRLVNTLNVSFPSADGEALRINLDLLGVCVSAGSACASGSVAPSHVLLALGLSPEQARSSLRISFGPRNTPDEALGFLRRLGVALSRSPAKKISG